MILNTNCHRLVCVLALWTCLAAAGEAQSPVFDFSGDGPNDRLGASVDRAGDVNNDGIEDIIVGAPEDGNVFLGGEGYARVYSGLDGTVLLDLTGDSGEVTFGASVAGIGDVDGDDHDDLAIGTPYHSAFGSLRGLVMVFSGQTGVRLTSIPGLVDGDKFGWVVAAVGDVNNDGTPDFAACSFNSDVVALNSGTVRVFSGADFSVLHTFEGQVSNAHLGQSITSMNFDNDSFDDIVVGGIRGSVMVYSGQTGAMLREYLNPLVDSGWGNSVRNLGDLSGDLVDDLIVGAPQESLFGVVGPGFARVIDGASGGTIMEMTGTLDGEMLGFSVDSAGDFDGDGDMDFMVGIPRSVLPSQTGIVQIFSGATGGVLETFNETTTGSGMGEVVRFLGDLTNDGVVDVCVGQPQESTLGGLVGSAQVYSGSPVSCDNPVPYCLSVPNTTGNSASIGFSGSSSYAANDLVLTAADCPPNQVGIFFYGPNQVFLPFGSGVRCVGGALFRMPPVLTIDANGAAVAPLNLNGLPNPSGQISQGETWNFQLWFRDPGDGNFNTNLTNALEVLFCE
jgi:hypothetical protein